eukprot:TRINITY_DN22079_c0_g1_i1.p1 TRINITY_DN22079_c0_g1~~TRINITY_DN22079_c0_g1_i1.p1  ORF type:complete len:224 (-),score=104.07 TRINITY_DN22079_c0_g1_i1:87-758(-)
MKIIIALFLFFACAFALKIEQVQGSGLECSACKFIVGKVEGLLESNKTETEILDDVEKSCNILISKTFIATCKGLVATYGPQIIQSLENKENPDTICSSVGLCNSTAVAEAPVASFKGVGGAIECGTCVFIAGRVENWVGQNKTEDEILHILETECDVLIDPKWVSSCKTIVEQNGLPIIEKIVSEEPAPSVLCSDLGFCSSERHNGFVHAKQMLGKTGVRVQ